MSRDIPVPVSSLFVLLEFNVTSTQVGHFVTGCPGRETCSGGWGLRTANKKQCITFSYTFSKNKFKIHKLARNIVSNGQ